MSQFITIIPTDNVYVGMCLAKAGLATVSLVDVRALQEAQSEIWKNKMAKRKPNSNLQVANVIFSIYWAQTAHSKMYYYWF